MVRDIYRITQPLPRGDNSSLVTRHLSLLVLILAWLYLSSTALAASSDGQHRKAQKELAAGNFTRAEGIYRELIDKDPKDVDAHLGLGLLFLKQHNLSAAYDEAISGLKLEPQNARAEAVLATALLRSGYLRLSVEHLRTALQLNVREDLALASAAELDLYENRPQEAFQKLKLATAQQPQEPDYWLIYARAASRLEYFKDAAEALRRFLHCASKADVERRERIEGVIKFYTYLGNTHLYRISGNKSATVPLQIKVRRPYLQVKVNGKGPLRFVVDTGSGVTVLSIRAAQRLGIREIARGGNAHAVGGEGTFPIVYGLLDELDIGGVKLATVPVYIREIHSATNGAPEDAADGFLGLSLLSNFLLTLDYKESELRLDVPGDAQSDQAIATDPPAYYGVRDEGSESPLVKTVVPFRMTESGLISVEGRLDGEANLNMIFDSGASSSVISASVVERENWQKKILENEVVRVIGAAGITENVQLMHADKLQIADLLRENLRMPVLNFARLNEHAGFEQQGILGGDFLHHCRVQIDFRRLQLVLTPYNLSLLKHVGELRSSAGEAK